MKNVVILLILCIVLNCGLYFVLILTRSNHKETVGDFAIPPLLSLLRNEDLTLTEMNRLIVTLHKAGYPRTTDTMLEVLKNQEENPRIRLRAAYVLAQIGDERAIEPLFSMLKSDWSYFRGDVELALGILGQLRDSYPYRSRDLFPGLLDVMRDESKDVHPRIHIAGMVAGWSDSDTMDALNQAKIFLLKIHENLGKYQGPDDSLTPEILHKALFKVAKKGGWFGEIVDILVDAMLNESWPTIRTNAINYLSEIGTKRAIEAIFQEAENDEECDPGVRLEALRALVNLYKQDKDVPLSRLKQAADKAAKSAETWDISIAESCRQLRDKIDKINSKK